MPAQIVTDSDGNSLSVCADEVATLRRTLSRVVAALDWLRQDAGEGIVPPLSPVWSVVDAVLGERDVARALQEHGVEIGFHNGETTLDWGAASRPEIARRAIDPCEDAPTPQMRDVYGRVYR